MLRRRFMLGDNIPKYPYTITVGYYASEKIPFLGGAYMHQNTNVMTTLKDNGKSFSLLNQSFDGSYGEYTISSGSPELGLIISRNSVSREFIYAGGLFAGALYRDSNGEILNKLDVVLSCILSGDIEYLALFGGYIDGYGPIPNTISELKLPESLKVIHEEALESWQGLKQLEIPMGVIELKESCLPWIGSNSVALRTLILKPTTPPISSNIFPDSEDIPEDFKIRVYVDCLDTYKNDVYYKDYADYIDTINNAIVYYNTNGRQLLEQLDDFITVSNNSKLKTATSIYLPNSVKYINYNAFYRCSLLTSFTIPNSVTNIGHSAFYDCSSLTSVTIPNSVTSIGYEAFYSCSSLTSVTIPNSVTSIGERAFSNCRKLTAVTIPESVTSIGESAFASCLDLKSVTINSDAIVNKQYSQNYSLANIFNQYVTEYVIGDNVIGIGDYTFYLCRSIPSITIPESVKSIGKSAFSYCLALTSVVWNAKNCADSSSSSYAPFYAIRSQITSFTFGENVEHIPASLCYDMKNLKSITIPNSVTSIGKLAFLECSSLTSITFNGTKAQWEGISLGYDWNINVPATVVHCTDGDVEL